MNVKLKKIISIYFACSLVGLAQFSCKEKTVITSDSSFDNETSNGARPKQSSFPREMSILCDSSKASARVDYNLNQLKYYYFGIASPPKEVISVLKKQCNISVKVMNCLVEKKYACYNEIGDSIIKAKTGLALSELVRKK